MVAALLRGVARGRQQRVYEGLHMAGPPLRLVDGRLLYGWGCDAAVDAGGCTGDGLFMAFDIPAERIFLALARDGAIELLAPRGPGWPEALRAPFTAFAPVSARPGGGPGGGSPPPG